MEKWQIAVDKLYAQYKKNGVIYEDDIYNTAEEMNLPLLKLEKICSVLNSKGVYISNNTKYNKDDEVLDYSQTDYNLIYATALEMSPTLFPLISHLKEVVPPQKNELSRLMIQIRSGNMYARERAIAMYIRTVIRIAVGYVDKTEVPLEDLVSEGTIGLITSIDKYDESVHGYFTSYASLWIRQFIDRYILRQKSIIYIPIHAHELLNQVEKEIEQYNGDNLNDMKEYIAHNLSISLDKLEKALHLLNPLISIDYEDFESDYSSSIQYFNINRNYDNIELRRNLLMAINILTEREKAVLLLRNGFFNNIEYTLEQVGNHFGVTRERIRQIESKALRKLRQPSIYNRLK